VEDPGIEQWRVYEPGGFDLLDLVLGGLTGGGNPDVGKGARHGRNSCSKSVSVNATLSKFQPSYILNMSVKAVRNRSILDTSNRTHSSSADWVPVNGKGFWRKGSLWVGTGLLASVSGTI
jgi:hypothetical protein